MISLPNKILLSLPRFLFFFPISLVCLRLCNSVVCKSGWMSNNLSVSLSLCWLLSFSFSDSLSLRFIFQLVVLPSSYSLSLSLMHFFISARFFLSAAAVKWIITISRYIWDISKKVHRSNYSIKHLFIFISAFSLNNNWTGLSLLSYLFTCHFLSFSLSHMWFPHCHFDKIKIQTWN